MKSSEKKLLDAFAAGDMGRVEFFELALETGLTLEQIEAALADAEEDL